MAYSPLRATCSDVKLWKITFAHVAAETWNLAFMLYGDVRLLKMFGERVQFFFQKCAFMGDSFRQLLEYCMIVYLHKIWILWGFSLEECGCVETSLSLKIYSFLMWFLRKLWIR
jgi:hypothetical protein